MATKSRTKIFIVKGIDCPACSSMLITELEEAGIEAKFSFAKETLSIINYSSEINSNLIGIFSKHGYIIREHNEKR